MPLSALLLALAAAFVHALWNLLLARARDPEAATAVALIVAVIVFAPVAVFAWGLERDVWPYLVVTSCLQLLYFSLLITAYRKAEVSVVYPVARGVAPTFVLLAGIVVLGYEHVMGTGCRRRPRRPRGARDPRRPSWRRCRRASSSGSRSRA